MGAPQRVLTLAFLRPGPNDPPFNHLVAQMCKNGICHAELMFEDNTAFSIFAGQQVFFKHRTLSNPDYELVSLSVSQAEYSSAYSFCQQAANSELIFTEVGMLASYLQPKACPFIHTASSLYIGSTFCSKIVTEALKFSEVREVEHLNPCTTTPSCLYEAVKDSQRKLLCSVPYKCDQLRRVGVLTQGLPRAVRMC